MAWTWECWQQMRRSKTIEDMALVVVVVSKEKAAEEAGAPPVATAVRALLGMVRVPSSCVYIRRGRGRRAGCEYACG